MNDEPVQNKMLPRKLKGLIALLSLLSMTAVLFDNCAASHDPGSENAAASVAGAGTFSTCSLTGPTDLFQLTYQPFLQNNCATCHTETGQAAGFPFASQALETAYNAFNTVGYQTVDTYAVNPGHQPPYTGAQNQNAINALSQQWTQGIDELSTCTQSSAPVFVTDAYAATRTYSKSKAVNPSLTKPVTVQWNLNTDMLAPPAGVTWPSMPGAYFQFTLVSVSDANDTHYLIYQPEIVYPTGTTSAVDLNVQSIMIKVNGVTVNNETTFAFVNANAYGNQTTMLAAGGMVDIGSIRASDVISFSIGQISVVNLPPPPTPPTVSFSVAAATTSVTAGTYNVTVNLNAPNTSIVTVNYGATGGTAVPNCCTTINDFNTNKPMPGQINWNRDYGLTLNSSNFVVFYPGTTSVTFPVTIYANARYTASFPTVILALTSLQVGSSPVTSLTTPPTTTLTISNTNPQPAVGTVTFSQLMGAGGAFALNCVGCHYPGNVASGTVPYDMTTYTSLLSNNRVVPGDPTSSLVWIRITDTPVLVNGAYVANGISAMPLNGVFNAQDPTGKSDIYSWIVNGALNN